VCTIESRDTMCCIHHHRPTRYGLYSSMHMQRTDCVLQPRVMHARYRPDLQVTSQCSSCPDARIMHREVLTIYFLNVSKRILVDSDLSVSASRSKGKPMPFSGEKIIRTSHGKYLLQRIKLPSSCTISYRIVYQKLKIDCKRRSCTAMPNVRPR
jgi:hypothetical protein